jgi:hypothetical protein
VKIIGIEEHLVSPDVLSVLGQLRPAPVKTQVNRSTLTICLECLRGARYQTCRNR